MTRTSLALAGVFLSFSLGFSAAANYPPRERKTPTVQQYCEGLSFEEKVQAIAQGLRRDEFKVDLPNGSSRYALEATVAGNANLRYYAIAEPSPNSQASSSSSTVSPSSSAPAFSLSVGQQVYGDQGIIDFHAVFPDPLERPREHTLYAGITRGFFFSPQPCNDHPDLSLLCSSFDVESILKNFCQDVVR